MRIRYLLLLLSLAIIISCGKDRIKAGSHLSKSHTAKVFDIEPLRDITLFLPTRTTVLSFTYSANYNPEISIEWKKISGPDNGNIKNPNAREAQFVNLEGGTYKIALQVSIPSLGIQHRDTMLVEVIDADKLKNERIFDNLHWVSPMGSTAEVIAPEIFSSGRPILVFAKTVNGWDTVPSIQIYGDHLPYPYYYQRYFNHIVMYTQTVPWHELTSAVKVRY